MTATSDLPSIEQRVKDFPAKFTPAVLDTVAELLAPLVPDGEVVLDPFAGVGGIHALYPRWSTHGIELEGVWAACHPRTSQGDALNLPWLDGTVPAVVTSCTYGNRMADSHNARDDSSRVTYTHRHPLKKLTPGNSAAMQWGPAYRDFHERAWTEVLRVLAPGGVFILNVSNHVRGGVVMRVAEWHISCLGAVGYHLREIRRVETPRMRYGQNHEARVSAELVVVATKGYRP